MSDFKNVSRCSKVKVKIECMHTYARVALCGLELEETQTNNKSLIGPPEEFVHGHTLPIMPTQMTGVMSAGEGRLSALATRSVSMIDPLAPAAGRRYLADMCPAPEGPRLLRPARARKHNPRGLARPGPRTDPTKNQVT